MDVTTIPQPDLYILGLRIQEFTTMLTDIVVAAVCFYAWWRLKQPKRPGKTQLYLRLYFLTMAFATFLAGIVGHGFLYVFGEESRLIGWYISMISIMLIERASIEHCRPLMLPFVGKFFLILNLLELVTLLVLTTVFLHFRFVEIHGVYGMLGIVFSFQLYSFIKTRNQGSKYMLLAVGVLVLAIVVFNYPIIPHVWFNHRDLAHILMAIASFVFLKGAQNLPDLTTKHTQ